MNAEQAIEAVKQVGISPGESLVIQSDGMIQNPHTSRQTGYEHTDAWKVTLQIRWDVQG